MDALIMAGGRGSRLGMKLEKPLLLFNGKPLVDHVISALKGTCRVHRIFAAVTARTPATARHLLERGVDVVLTPGGGFVEDLRRALRALELGPTLVVASDLPLLRRQEVEEVLREYRRCGLPAMATMIPLQVFTRYGLTPTMVLNEMVPAGVNIVDGRKPEGREHVYITENIRLAVNVNRPGDLRKAEEIRRILDADKQ